MAFWLVEGRRSRARCGRPRWRPADGRAPQSSRRAWRAPRRARVGLVDGGLAVGHAGLRDVALGEQKLAEGELRLVGRGISGVLRRGAEARDGALGVAHGHAGLALVGAQGAHVPVGGVRKRRLVRSCRLGEHAELHQRVAAQVIGLAGGLGGIFAGREELRGAREVARLVRSAGLLKQKVVHGCLLLHSKGRRASARRPRG